MSTASARLEARTAAVVEEFARHYARPATFVARAPGRVNLLGEHTDYNGLPVLPMAIDRNALIAGARRDDRLVCLHNSAPAFAERSFEISDAIAAGPAGDWGNYARAAAQGLVGHFGGQLRHGADLLVDGNIPSSAGLSSSSALVVATALALLTANGVDVPYATLADILPAAERYVGTLSGGMDHAISLLARAGQALRIDFFPLRVRPVALPATHCVVVCHSLVHAEKSGAAKQAYNQRVVECRLACRVLERALGVNLPRRLTVLGDLATLFPGRPLLDFLPYINAPLYQRPASLSEIATALGTSAERLQVDCEIPSGLSGPFSLERRLRHVLSEAERVDRAEAALGAGDVSAFGELMNASHASCRDDYEISCPELEDLVRIARQAGAVGARLTGAGFGGCTVNLVGDGDLGAFLTRVDRYFYASRLSNATPPGEHRFVFTPQAGAAVDWL